MYGVATTLSTSKPDESSTPAKQIEDWTHANKVCQHTLLNALSNDFFDVYCSYKESKRNLRFVDSQIYCRRRWEMIEDKDIKIQINEYHKLLDDIKVENILMPNEFVSELLIEKLSSSYIDYKQQLKHRHKQMTLQELITHMIIEDTNRKECATIRAKALSIKTNVVEDKSTSKRYENKPDHKRKNNFRNSYPNGSNPTFKKKGNCFVCGKSGHHTPQCRHRARNDNPPRANITQGKDTIVVFAFQLYLMTNMSKWVVDSSVTKNICANVSVFTFYTSVEDGEGHVYLGDFKTTPILGK